MVSVMISSSSGEAMMRSSAGGESTPWLAQAKTARAPCVHDRLRRRAERAGRVDHVVDDDGVASLDVADDVHHLADVGRGRRLSMMARLVPRRFE